MDDLVRLSAKRTHSLFAADFAQPSGILELERPPIYTFESTIKTPASNDAADRANVASRIQSEYADVAELPAALAAKQAAAAATAAEKRRKMRAAGGNLDKASDARMNKMIESSGKAGSTKNTANGSSQALTLHTRRSADQPPNADGPTINRDVASTALVRREAMRQVKPKWQAPWKLMRVVSGHLGWVRALAVDPDNHWFASGAGDRTIKIWDMATGNLRLTLTGHISSVRGLAVSPRHPYLFSCGEDKMVKCWDLETNKVIRHYHGHLSGVYTLALHPTLDVLVTGGRDGAVRVWDMRTRSNIHVLSGHKGTISSVVCQETDPQVISGSLDSTVRLWDLAAGKSMGVLTHHKKGVRALATHPREFSFASGSSHSIKQWKLPEGALLQNFDGHNSIVNTLAVNDADVLMSGGDDGSMYFWDWKSGHCFQKTASLAQPGSLDAEAGIMSSVFDNSGSRLITGEADKTIKVWKQDESATEESHPLEWKPTLGRKKY